MPPPYPGMPPSPGAPLSLPPHAPRCAAGWPGAQPGRPSGGFWLTCCAAFPAADAKAPWKAIDTCVRRGASAAWPAQATSGRAGSAAAADAWRQRPRRGARGRCWAGSRTWPGTCAGWWAQRQRRGRAAGARPASASASGAGSERSSTGARTRSRGRRGSRGAAAAPRGSLERVQV